MSITQEYVKHGEECERLADACRIPSNREILLYAAAHWRTMAEDASAGSVPAAPAKVMQDADADTAQGERGLGK